MTIQLPHPQLLTYKSVCILPVQKFDHWNCSANPLTHFKFELLLCPSRATFHLTSKYSERTAVSMVEWQYLYSQILLGVHSKTGNSIFLRIIVRMNVCCLRNSAGSEKTSFYIFASQCRAWANKYSVDVENDAISQSGFHNNYTPWFRKWIF
jgi:hypothetical protein